MIVIAVVENIFITVVIKVSNIPFEKDFITLTIIFFMLTTIFLNPKYKPFTNSFKKSIILLFFFILLFM